MSDLRPDEIPRLRRRLGVVFQDFRLLEDRTAAENIAFALEVTGARRDTIAARVMRVLTQVGLAAKSRAYPRELSGGEQQRVAIARALVNDPAILRGRRAHRQPRRARHARASSSSCATSTPAAR